MHALALPVDSSVVLPSTVGNTTDTPIILWVNDKLNPENMKEFVSRMEFKPSERLVQLSAYLEGSIIKPDRFAGESVLEFIRTENMDLPFDSILFAGARYQIGSTPYIRKLRRSSGSEGKYWLSEWHAYHMGFGGKEVLALASADYLT